MLLAYVSNILDNPAEPKFRRIKKENKAFVGRVACCGDHGVNFLTLCGFGGGGRPEYLPPDGNPDDFLVCQQPEGEEFAGSDLAVTLKAAKTELTKSIENPFWL